MRKICVVLFPLVLALSLSGFESVPRSDYDSLLAEKEALQAEYDAMQAEREELLSEVERFPVTICGTFTATVLQLMPDYVLDDFTPTLAIVQEFQCCPFMFNLGPEIAAQIEVGKTYEFSIEEREISLTREQIETTLTGPEVIIPLYGLKIASVIEAEKVGVDADSSINIQ